MTLSGIPFTQALVDLYAYLLILDMGSRFPIEGIEQSNTIKVDNPFEFEIAQRNTWYSHCDINEDSSVTLHFLANVE